MENKHKEQFDAINGQILLLKEKLKTAVDTYERMKGEDEEFDAMKLGKIEYIEQSLEASKQELERYELMIERSNIDWSKHKSSIIRVSWNSTSETHSTSNFKRRDAINVVMRQAIESMHVDQVGILLPGPTGSGKTTAAKWIGGEVGRPVVSMNFSNNMEEIDILGGPTIDAEGKVKMIDGPLTEAVRYGAIFVAEEINFAKPGVMAILNTLLDGNQQIILPSGEVVKAAPGFKFIGTYNPGYAGTRELNRALINRFGTIIYFEKPTHNLLKEIIENRTGYGKTEDEKINITKLLTIEDAVDKLIKKEDFMANISVRQHIAVIRLLQTGKSIPVACKYGLVNQVANSDDELKTKIENIVKTIAGMSDNEFKNAKEQIFGGQ